MSFTKIRDYRPRGQSMYDLYPLPFFNKEGHCTWDIRPTGDYSKDCETGAIYAEEFLLSCDGTRGWSSLLGQIVADMIRAGTNGTFADGRPKVNGVVVGFMGGIGRALCSHRNAVIA